MKTRTYYLLLISIYSYNATAKSLENCGALPDFNKVIFSVNNLNGKVKATNVPESYLKRQDELSACAEGLLTNSSFKLCRDESNNIMRWSFHINADGSIGGIISHGSSISTESYLSQDSSLCGEVTGVGNFQIINSQFKGKFSINSNFAVYPSEITNSRLTSIAPEKSTLNGRFRINNSIFSLEESSALDGRFNRGLELETVTINKKITIKGDIQIRNSTLELGNYDGHWHEFFLNKLHGTTLIDNTFNGFYEIFDRQISNSNFDGSLYQEYYPEIQYEKFHTISIDFHPTPINGLIVRGYSSILNSEIGQNVQIDGRILDRVYWGVRIRNDSTVSNSNITGSMDINNSIISNSNIVQLMAYGSNLSYIHSSGVDNISWNGFGGIRSSLVRDTSLDGFEFYVVESQESGSNISNCTILCDARIYGRIFSGKTFACGYRSYNEPIENIKSFLFPLYPNERLRVSDLYIEQ